MNAGFNGRRPQVVETEGPDDHDPGAHSWHLDKRLNVGHLIATGMLAVSIMSWGASMDRRIAVLEEKATTYRAEQQRQDEQLERALATLREDAKQFREEIREVSRKIDRLVEGRSGPQR